jgi:hypothetical protein
MFRAFPARSASAAISGAVAAHAMPPPCGDSNISWLVPKCSWYARASKLAPMPPL